MHERQARLQTVRHRQTNVNETECDNSCNESLILVYVCLSLLLDVVDATTAVFFPKYARVY